MKKIILYLMMVLLLVSMGGCEKNGGSAPDLLEPVGVKLDTAVVERGEIYETKVYSGEVVPYVEELSFAVDGRLGEIKVRVGDIVRKGQVLATLDNEQIQNQIDNLEEEIAYGYKMGEYNDRIAQIDIDVAKEQLAIMRESGAVASVCRAKELEIEQMKLDLEQSQELRELELEYKESRLAKLRKQVTNAEIVSSVNGRVVYVTTAKEGSSVNAYATIIGVADDDRLSISTEHISTQDIEDADEVYARVLDQDIDITYVPIDSKEYVAMVLAGEIVKSEFMIETDSEKIQSGQFAAVVLMDSYKENVLTIPANAVYRDEKGRYVYKIEGDERIRCNVTLGIVTDVKAEIVEGLQEGDVVYVKE